MTSTPAPAGTTVLAPHECWQLLRTVSVGRLAVWVHDHPDIFPINFTVDHGTLVFRTGEGTKLDAALGGSPVAVEADGVDPATGIAWSVVLKGTSSAIITIGDVLDSAGLPLFPWQEGHKDHFLRIAPTTVTGRRFKVTDPKTWWDPMAAAPHAAPE